MGYTYDNDGLLTNAGDFTINRNAQTDIPESVTSGGWNMSRNFSGYGELDGLGVVVAGQNLSSWNVTRNNAGRIAEKSETILGATSNFNYTYDAMGRLLSVTKDGNLVEEYAYDLNGARVYEMNTFRGISGRSFSYLDEDHLLVAGDATYSYDSDGFLTSKTEGPDVTTYQYSSKGELLTVNLPDGRMIEYLNDPLGQRIVKKVNGAMVEKYLWQGQTRLLAVYDGLDNLVIRFEYADDRMPLAMTKSGNKYFLSYDQVGSIRMVADSTGNVVKIIDYDLFGNIIGDL